MVVPEETEVAEEATVVGLEDKVVQEDMMDHPEDMVIEMTEEGLEVELDQSHQEVMVVAQEEVTTVLPVVVLLAAAGEAAALLAGA